MHHWLSEMDKTFGKVACYVAVFRGLFVSSQLVNQGFYKTNWLTLMSFCKSLDTLCLPDILINCSRCWGWGVIDTHWKALPGQLLQWIIILPGTVFLCDKDKDLVYRRKTLWFWLSLLLDLGVLLLLRAFATDVELRIDALPQDDLGRCLHDLLVWQTR